MQWCRTLKVCYLLIDAVESRNQSFLKIIQAFSPMTPCWVRRPSWSPKKFHQGFGVSCSRLIFSHGGSETSHQCSHAQDECCDKTQGTPVPNRKLCSIAIWNVSWNIFKVTTIAALCWFFGNLDLSFDPTFFRCPSRMFHHVSLSPGGAFWIHLQSLYRAWGQKVPWNLERCSRFKTQYRL